ncbi:hypothetical protein BsWGS_09548 [Bradybaena similaris]
MAASSIVSHLILFAFLIVLSGGEEIESCKKPSCVYVALNATQIEPSEITVQAGKQTRKLCILCYPGQVKTWYKLWVNPKITIKRHNPETDLDFYYGHNISEIVERSQESSFLNWPVFFMMKESYAFDPFNHSCIGLASEKGYAVVFRITNPELRFVLYTIVGLMIMFLAAPLSRNMYLQYGTGISVGVLGSLLLVVFIISRFLPQKLKNLGYVVIAVSTSASMYLYQWISSYFGDIIKNHWQILLGYTAVMGLVSFAVVYRYGPVTNQRTLNLVKWALQLLGLIMVYQGSQIPEVSVAIIIVAVVLYLFPPSFLGWLKKVSYRYRFFRPKTKLLTEEEYYTEGSVETKKALDELRSFCHSPGCDAWKTISRLTSPSKFASFVEGSFHLSDAELEEHNTFYSSEVMDDTDSEVDYARTDR